MTYMLLLNCALKLVEEIIQGQLVNLMNYLVKAKCRIKMYNRQIIILIY